MGMGYNGNGALGNGSSYEDYRDIDYDGQRESIEPNPIRIASAEVVNVAAARFASLFVKQNGSLLTTGDTLSSSTPFSLVPKMILESGVVQVEVVQDDYSGHDEIFVLDNNGSGENINKLTYNTDQIIIESGAKSLGDRHLLILMWDGSVWGVGNNEFGQLGNGQDSTEIIQILCSLISRLKFPH